jgi:hypothetical protein
MNHPVSGMHGTFAADDRLQHVAQAEILAGPDDWFEMFPQAGSETQQAQRWPLRRTMLFVFAICTASWMVTGWVIASVFS